jgi:hypothetical protein
MEHCKFGSGNQCDLQSVRKGDFAGRGKIGWMKNRFKFNAVRYPGLNHELASFRAFVARSRVVIVVLA